MIPRRVVKIRAAREIKAVYGRNKCPGHNRHPPTSDPAREAFSLPPRAGRDLRRTLVILYISGLALASETYNLVV